MTSPSSVTSGLTMLTSGVSQYLHPDYLQPLPTTLDAKKSPLALLAQTCSAIGKDTSPSKPIIPPLEKSSTASNSNDNNNNHEKQALDRSAGGDSDSSSSSSSSSKRPGSRTHKESGRESSAAGGNKPGFRTFPLKDIPPLVPVGPESNLGSSKTIRVPSAGGEPKPASSPLTNAGASALTVPPHSLLSPRPVSANGAPRSSSRSSNSGKGGESGDQHHSHSQHNGSHHHHHHHHHQSSSNGHLHSSSSSSSSQHRQRDSPASSSSSTSSSHSRPSSSPNYSKSGHPASSSSSVMLSPSSGTTYSNALLKSQPPLPHPAVSHPSMLAGLPAHLAAAGYHNPLALMGHGLDPASYHSVLAAHSSLSSYAAAAAAAQSSAALKAAAGAGAPPAAFSPFVTYARVRTPSGATTLVPVCRDPYCTNCQLTVQNSHLAATCTAPGCAQCAHEKSLTSLSALGALPGASAAASSMLLPPLPPSSSGSLSAAGSMSALSSLHSLYPHSALAAAAAAAGAHNQQHPAGFPPYVCNWVAGSDYCGKRFSSSEELLQHLRSHTSSLDAATTNSLVASAYAGLGAGAGALPSALAASYPHLAPPLSPNSLRRAAYPTSLSPVSSLLSASRYHPYKSPLSGVGTAPPPQSLPPVGPYYSPYTLYGQRLGAAVVP